MSDDEKFTLTDTDHEAIANRLFEKAEASHTSNTEEKKDEEGDKKDGSLTLTDDDRKGIAAHLHQLTKDEAEKSAKDKDNDNKDKKQQQEHAPKPPRNLFERSIFSIGGGS